MSYISLFRYARIPAEARGAITPSMDKSSSSESESGSESSSGEDTDSASERARKVLLLQEQVRNLSRNVATKILFHLP